MLLGIAGEARAGLVSDAAALPCRGLVHAPTLTARRPELQAAAARAPAHTQTHADTHGRALQLPYRAPVIALQKHSPPGPSHAGARSGARALIAMAKAFVRLWP